MLNIKLIDLFDGICVNITYNHFILLFSFKTLKKMTEIGKMVAFLAPI